MARILPAISFAVPAIRIANADEHVAEDAGKYHAVRGECDFLDSDADGIGAELPGRIVELTA